MSEIMPEKNENQVSKLKFVLDFIGEHPVVTVIILIVVLSAVVEILK